MKTLKNLFNLLFKSEKTAVPAPQPTRKLAPPMFEDSALKPRAGLAPVRTNGHRHHLAGTTRNNIGRAFSMRREVGASRSHTDTRSAEELFRDGYLRTALAGFNSRGFTINPFARSTDPRLAEQVANLPTQIKMVPHHNVAAGLQVSLQMLSRSPAGRTGIVILTSDEPTTTPTLARQLVQTAIRWKTAIHTIQITADLAEPGMLASLSTRSSLGYGGFHNVTPDDELIEVFRNELNGLTPARGMIGVNSVLFLVDCSERMVESFGGSTRIEMVASALQQYLHNPFLRRNGSRLALAA